MEIVNLEEINERNESETFFLLSNLKNFSDLMSDFEDK